MTGQGQSILVVDDDERLRNLVRLHLESAGYRVTTVTDGRHLGRVIIEKEIDLIVLDLNLPYEDGLSLCRQLRSYSDTPVLMLTARGDTVDRIVGLEMGADDYLSKPFSPRELVARISAILRRVKAEASPRTDEGTFSFGKYTFDHQRMALTREGQPVLISVAEANLLSIFVQHVGQPMSRDALMVLSRGRHHEPFDRTIDVQIGRLRKIIEDDPARPRHLQTVWGKGYILCPE
jgi:two-component system, OmpR family, phosphate regulon response regulator OmpR